MGIYSHNTARTFKEYLTIGITLGISTVVTFDVIIRLTYILNLSTFWNYPKLLLLAIILPSIGITAWVLGKYCRIFVMKVSTKRGFRFYVLILNLYSLTLIGLSLLRLPNPLIPLSLFFATDRMGIVLEASNIFIHFVIVTWILFVLVFSSNPLDKKNLLGSIQSRQYLLFYNRLFLSVLVIFGLTSLSMLSNIVPNDEDKNDLLDNVWNNSFFMGIYEKSRYKIGDQLLNSSLRARDHWFVYAGENSLDDYQNTIPFTDKDLSEIQRKLDQFSTYLELRGIKLIVIVPPNKNTIFPEYMPDQIPVIGDQSRLDQLISYEKDHGTFKIINLKPDFFQAKSRQEIYFACGTHWNTLGAFIAYQNILYSLEDDFPKIKPHSLNDYRIVSTLGDTDLVDSAHLDRAGCNGIDLEPLFARIVTTQHLVPKREIARSFTSPSYIISVNDDSTLPRLLMYRDSFSTYLTPLLSDHFSYSAYLWATPDENMYDLVNIEKPDVFIIEYTERYIDFLLKIPG